jgi:cytochrome c oxidase assembly protein subunit 15
MAEKRSIFEEVKEAGGRAGPVLTAVGAIDRAKGARRGIRLWLMLLAALVSAMILVGGLTRLTDSGLAITEWKPVMGALPPLSEADWQAAYGRYQATEEFRAQNNAMTLAEFKPLYWWEWSHRQLGRVIGLVWAVGFFGFLAARRIPVGWTRRLLLVGVLGGVQGAVGWWMVTSGLTGTALDVASTRLAVHLGLAFAILGLLLWYCFLMGRTEADLMKARRAGEPRLAGLATGLMHLAFLQILLGALVAGIDAGRGHTDWPLMAGRFFPEGAFDIVPAWRNLFENAGLVQFVHRIGAYLLLVLALVALWRGRRSGHVDTARAFANMFALLLLQAVIGIATVMSSAPLGLSLLHQAGAVLAFGMILRARYLARYPIQRSLRGR